jgi:hypothetical protein
MAASKILTASQLTTSERFIVDRWRRNEDQAQAAHRLGKHTARYHKWERMDFTGLAFPEAEEVAKGIVIGPLTKIEACKLARRREGADQADVAKAMGIPRYHVINMERGVQPIDELYAFWANGSKVKSGGKAA